MADPVPNPTPPITGPNGTVDITNVVTTMQSTFVTLATTFLTTAILATGPGAAIWPFVSWFAKPLMKWVLNTLAGWAVLQAFFMNTAIRKNAQALDYVNAVAAKGNLPPTATDAEYKAAEVAEMQAFTNFVMVTN